MVSEEQFNEGKKRIKNFWPEDRIISDEPNKLVLKCENGAYLIYRRLIIPPELQDNPQVMATMHEKVMIQFTEKLGASSYNNVSAEVVGKREPKGRVKEALEELATRVHIANILYS